MSCTFSYSNINYRNFLQKVLIQKGSKSNRKQKTEKEKKREQKKRGTNLTGPTQRPNQPTRRDPAQPQPNPPSPTDSGSHPRRLPPSTPSTRAVTPAVTPRLLAVYCVPSLTEPSILSPSLSSLFASFFPLYRVPNRREKLAGVRGHRRGVEHADITTVSPRHHFVVRASPLVRAQPLTHSSLFIPQQSNDIDDDRISPAYATPPVASRRHSVQSPTTSTTSSPSPCLPAHRRHLAVAGDPPELLAVEIPSRHRPPLAIAG